MPATITPRGVLSGGLTPAVWVYVAPPPAKYEAVKYGVVSAGGGKVSVNAAQLSVRDERIAGCLGDSVGHVLSILLSDYMPHQTQGVAWSRVNWHTCGPPAGREAGAGRPPSGAPRRAPGQTTGPEGGWSPGAALPPREFA